MDNSILCLLLSIPLFVPMFKPFIIREVIKRPVLIVALMIDLLLMWRHLRNHRLIIHAIWRHLMMVHSDHFLFHYDLLPASVKGVIEIFPILVPRQPLFFLFISLARHHATDAHKNEHDYQNEEDHANSETVARLVNIDRVVVIVVVVIVRIVVNDNDWHVVIC